LLRSAASKPLPERSATGCGQLPHVMTIEMSSTIAV
jgi:hypothetical protein